MTAPEIDLTDVDAFVAGDHHAMFGWLRAHAPVYRHTLPDGGGFWALTRYGDVAAAYLDPALSSVGGPMLGGSFQRGGTDSAAQRMLVASDPPQHRLLRTLIQRAFAPAALDRVAEQVRRLVDAALDRIRDDGGGDVADGIATALPAGALMGLMGLDENEARELIGMTRRMIGFRDPDWVDLDREERLRLAALQADILEFFADALRRHRDAGPADDDTLLSVLAGGRLNGRALDEQTVLYNCMNVAVGGNETSSHTATAGILALAENPDQHDELLDRPELVDRAVQEFLRWGSTNAYVTRVAAADLEIGGTTIPAGDLVTLWNVSANRDGAEFEEPDRFVVGRDPNRHITYGVGPHRCIGATIAQTELRILLRGIVERGLRFTVDDEPVRLRSNFIQGINSLPVEVRAR